MYNFYLSGELLPIAPSKVETQISGSNKTINLINEGSINMIKSPDLTEISFECTIPMIQNYPFAKYKNNEFKAGIEFLNHFEKLMTGGKPFRLRITRKSPTKEAMPETVMPVTLEDYTIVEDVEKSGLDCVVSIKLKQYRYYGTKKLVVKKATANNNGTVVAKLEDTSNRSGKDTPKNYTVKNGDTLSGIAKSQCGSVTKASEIYKLNKTVIENAAKKNGKASSSNGHWIYKGTVLKMPT